MLRNITLIASYLAFACILSGCAGSRPAHLGTLNSTLTPCPDKPNCVSSLAEKDEPHYIAPLEAANQKAVRTKLVKLLKDNPQAQLQVSSPTYLYAEFTSEWLGFVDDVEFLFSQQNGLVHVRSASRLGYADFGVNRDRIEQLRDQLNQ